MNEPVSILDQYRVGDVVARVAAALDHAGFGAGTIPWQALAPLDQFHVGGAAATAALAERLEIAPGAELLDVGCGLGGPARYLAAMRGCTVTGIDLNPALIDLAAMLTVRTGLAERVSFQVADATALPFPADSFDIAWTQHVAMNIADRRELYGGIHRVLRQGGLFAIYDVVAGETAPLHFSVPWARDPQASHLLTAAAMRDVLEACGFAVLHWADATADGLAWIAAQADAAADRPEPLRRLALPLVMGPDFPSRTANLRRNLAEGRAGLVQAIVQRI